MSGRLSGKVAIVTGAARGQGEAEARLFVAEGASVIVTDVLDDLGDAVADSTGASARFVHHDVTSEQDWDRVVAAAMTGFGRVDVLVNNAGVSRIQSIESETIDDFDRVMATNASSVFLGIRSAIAPMRAAGGGSIINIASMASLVGIPDRIAYTASKFAVRGMTKTAAIELARYRIRVNAVLPGPIATDMLAGADDDIARKLPLGRVGTAEDVAKVVLYLASDESSYVSGSEVSVDGALTCGKSPADFGR